MTAIGSATNSGIDLANHLRGSFGRSETAPGGGSAGITAPKGTGSGDSATIIDLSDRAKVILERAKADQEVVDHLDRALSSGKNGGTAKRPLSKEGEAIMAKYGDLPNAESWAAAASADNVGLLAQGLANIDLPTIEDQVRRMNAGQEVNAGTADMTDDERFAYFSLLGLVSMMVGLEDSGRTEEASALRIAITNGTVEVKKASDVPELNSVSTVPHFADAGGGGTGSDWHYNPTGDAKALLDACRAQAFEAADRGVFFVSW